MTGSWFWIALGPAILLRLVMAWTPLETSFALSVPDDAYYYFGIARNIASTGEVTFDGTTPTNGFHPLWLILITPLWWLFGGSDALPIHLALSLGILLDTVTMFGLFRLALELTGHRTAAALTVLCYAWNPYTAAASVNGLETSLGTCLFVWTLLAYVQIRNNLAAGSRQWFGLGLLVSLLGLARTDYWIIALPCGLDLLWRNRSRLRSAWPAAFGLALWLPWLAWNFSRFGTFWQVSGQAYPYYLHAIWAAEDGSWGTWLAVEAEKAYGIAANLARFSGFSKGVLPLAVFLAVLVFSAWRDRDDASAVPRGFPSWNRIEPLIWASLGTLATLLVHGLVRWMYLPWYFVPAAVLAALWFGAFLAWAAQRRFTAALAAAVFLVFQILQTGQLAAEGGMWPEQARTAAALRPVLVEQCQTHKTIGVTDSGYLGYHSPCRVVNLDGVVNNEAFRAIQEGRFRQYLDDEGIGFILLNPIVRRVVELREGPVPELPPFSQPQPNRVRTARAGAASSN